VPVDRRVACFNGSREKIGPQVPRFEHHETCGTQAGSRIGVSRATLVKLMAHTSREADPRAIVACHELPRVVYSCAANL